MCGCRYPSLPQLVTTSTSTAKLTNLSRLDFNYFCSGQEDFFCLNTSKKTAGNDEPSIMFQQQDKQEQEQGNNKHEQQKIKLGMPQGMHQQTRGNNNSQQTSSSLNAQSVADYTGTGNDIQYPRFKAPSDARLDPTSFALTDANAQASYHLRGGKKWGRGNGGQLLLKTTW